MTKLSHKPAQPRPWLGAMLGASLACTSLEPLDSYSRGGRTTPEPAAAMDATPALEAEQPASAVPVLDTPEGNPEVPSPGEIALQPAPVAEEPSATPPTPDPEPTPDPMASCAGVGEFPSADGAACYRRSTQTASWNAALSDCQAWGGALVSIESRAEDDFLGQELDATFWIGASDLAQKGRMVWNDGQPLTFSNWGTGEPNDFQGREDCVVKALPGGLWNDVPCASLYQFVCERGTP